MPMINGGKGTFWKFSSLLLLFLGSLLIFSSPSLATGEQNAEPPTKTVLDCYSPSMLKSCSFREITSVAKDCKEWYEPSSIKDLECNFTSEGLEEVTLITDPANYITAPLTKERYTLTSMTSVWTLALLALKDPLGVLAQRSSYFFAWDLEFISDDSYLVTLKNGKILHFREGKSPRFVDIDITPLDGTFSGLLGMAKDPSFDENRHVYLYYTTESLPKNGSSQQILLNRISRFTFDSENERMSDEIILLDGIPGNAYRLGGRLKTGPDRKLYATTGDGNIIGAQNLSYLGGKILRMNLNGSVPPDNPFRGSVVYSYGHRNPQGLAWRPGTNELIATEHGPWRHDEINLISKGSNYGWPILKCDVPSGQYVLANRTITLHNPASPLACFDTWSLAPSGITFADDPNSPWHGDLFIAGLRGSQIHRVHFGDGTVSQEILFSPHPDTEGYLSPRMRDVEFHDGSLWILSDYLWVAKITPVGKE